MAEFIVREAQDVDIGSSSSRQFYDDQGEDVPTVSDDEFIDDSEQVQSEYPYFANVTRTYSDAMQVNIENYEDIEARHYFDSDDNGDDDELHDFSNFKAKARLFRESLICPHGLENPDSFFYAILYAIRHKFTEKVDFLQDENRLKEDVGLALSHDLFEIKSLLRLDGQDRLNFENQCFKINRILNKHNMFLRVFELKDKFHYILKQNSKQKQYFSEISACVIERFNGFTIVRLEFDNEIRKEFTPIDIIYKPVKKLEAILDCFFTKQLHLAYKAVYNKTKNIDDHRSSCAFECYFCGKFWVRKQRLEIHMKNCVGKPGFVYNFKI